LEYEEGAMLWSHFKFNQNFTKLPKHAFLKRQKGRNDHQSFEQINMDNQKDFNLKYQTLQMLPNNTF